MDYLIQKKILLITISAFTIAISSAYGYNDFTFSVEQPELTIGSKKTPLLNQQKQTALSSIAMQMQSRTDNDLMEFTKVSLHEMSTLYKEESIRAGREYPSTKKKRQKLYSWSFSTLKYAHYLQEILESIDTETPIELHIGNTGELLFIINGLPFIVNGPLINRPDIIEQRIINTVCSYKDCDVEFPGLQQKSRKKNIIIQAGWRMDEKKQPEYVTDDGLHFIFSNIKNRARKQEICLNIIKELKLIVHALKETSEKGIFLDWDSMHIESDAEHAYYRIIINAFGDAVIVNLMELPNIPELTKLSLSWIKARVESKPYQQNLYVDVLFAGEVRKQLMN